MHYKQRTLATPVKCSGVGVHSGKTVNLKIKPAPANHGIKFVRTDLPDNPSIHAIFHMVVDTSLATVIGRDGVIVSTIEHLMAAFSGLAIENAIVELDSYEMPIMDGSAKLFTKMIQDAGIKELDSPRFFFIVKKPIEFERDDKFVAVYPASNYKISCSIEFDHPLIRKQSISLDVTDAVFAREVASARTFGFYRDIEFLKQYGLARGATLESGIALENNRVMNPEGLRFEDEFVRHKLLDCIGDFSLLGMPIIGHVEVKKTGHAFNYSFLKEFFSRKECWDTRPLYEN